MDIRLPHRSHDTHILHSAEGRATVVLVVCLDLLEQNTPVIARPAQLEPRFETGECAVGLAEINLPLEMVERLHLLDGVTLHRRPKPLPDHAVQINEYFPSNK